MKAQHPLSNQWYYFIDKCLPFGSAKSCAIFQKFSDALAHVVYVKTGFLNINYLDDFLFVAYLELYCDNQIKVFLSVCETINFPVALDKTVWSSEQLTFLGLLIDAKN